MKGKMNLRFSAKTVAAAISAAVVTSFASSQRNAGIAKASLDIENYGGGGKPYSVLMTIPSSSDTRGFAWQTDSSATNCSVALESNGKRTLFTGETILIKDPSISCHKAVATSLAPGRYRYEIKSGNASERGEFTVKAPSDDTVTIVNFSDAQTKDATKLHVWENTCAVASRTVGGANKVDFIINCGDHEDRRFRNARSNVFDKFSEFTLWGIAVDTARPYFPNVPWIMASGNHDHKIYRNVTAERWALEKFGGCRSLDYGNVHVATIPWILHKLDSNVERSLKWLEDDLDKAKKSKKIDWIIVAMHMGPYTTGDNSANEKNMSDYVKRVGALCAAKHVDLVLQGHDHTFSKTLPYRWDATGWTSSEGDDKTVNLKVKKKKVGGKTWDCCPRGTYYVSIGCSGHRVGECGAWADINGKHSYWKRPWRVYIGETIKGENASADTGVPMFGVIRVKGKKLSFGFYLANPDGTSSLHDELNIMK